MTALWIILAALGGFVFGVVFTFLWLRAAVNGDKVIPW